MLFDTSRKRFDITENFTRFFQHESCGFCTSCRVGTTLLSKHLEDVKTSGKPLAEDHARSEEIHALATLINSTSHCGLGHTAGNPVLQYIQHQQPNNSVFGALSNSRIKPIFDVDAAQSDVQSAENKGKSKVENRVENIVENRAENNDNT